MTKQKQGRKTHLERFEHFVARANEKHGVGRYSYDLAKEDYAGIKEKVRIICNNCKETFSIIPQSHTSKSKNRHGGCTKCHSYNDKIRDSINIRWQENRVERMESFLKRMAKRHEGLYLYPYIAEEFKDESSMITVLCTKCDSEFVRKAECLKKENRYAGCLECNKEKMKQTIAEKNRVKQLHNYTLKDVVHPFGFIYKIINTKNGKFYIGYTNMTVERRFKSHTDEARRLARGIRKCMSYLHNAMNHHGVESFMVETLETFQNVTPIELGQMEMKYISELEPPYNLSAGGELGSKKLVS